MTFNIGDKVLRKSPKRELRVGTVASVTHNGKLVVRWPMARWRNANGTITSTLSARSVVAATDDEIEKRRNAILERRAQPIWDRFCQKCGHLFKDVYDSDYICPDCKEQATGERT